MFMFLLAQTIPQVDCIEVFNSVVDTLVVTIETKKL